MLLDLAGFCQPPLMAVMMVMTVVVVVVVMVVVIARRRDVVAGMKFETPVFGWSDGVDYPVGLDLGP